MKTKLFIILYLFLNALNSSAAAGSETVKNRLMIEIHSHSTITIQSDEALVVLTGVATSKRRTHCRKIFLSPSRDGFSKK